MWNATSPKCFEIVSTNLSGVSESHIRRLNAKEEHDILIDYNQDIVAKRCAEYLKIFMKRLMVVDLLLACQLMVLKLQKVLKYHTGMVRF